MVKSNVVEELSSAAFELKFYDLDGALAAPDTLVYSLHDKITGTEIIAATTINTVTSTYLLKLPAASNAIINYELPLEEHILTLQAIFGVDQRNKEISLWIENLQFLS